MRFAQYLEAVTNPQYLTAFIGEIDHTLHHWAETGNSTATQVIPVGEAAGQHDTIFGGEHAEVLILVPQHYNFLIQIILQGILHITVTI